MACVAAVGIDDDLTAGQAGIALRAAHDEAAGGVDIILGVLVQQLGGDGGLDDLLHHVGAQLLHADGIAVLAGNDHSVHADGLAVHVLDSDLALAVRTQIVQLAALADFGQLLGQLVGQADGHGHQLGGLVAGITEHHALVAGAADLIVGAEGDVGALAVDVGDDGAGVGVESELCAGIADVSHDLADGLLEIDVAVGGDLAHDVDEAGGCAGLAGHTGVGVVGQDLVEDGVGDLVADLVGMALGDGLRSKQTVLCHFCTSLALGCVCINIDSFLLVHQVYAIKNAQNRSSERCTLIFRFPAGFGTLCSHTGCRASQGLSPQPLLISRYSVCPGNILSLLRRNVKKSRTLF